ncbi:hypothetical protein BIW11_06901, partial [Tropilaelaps mercedesae]
YLSVVWWWCVFQWASAVFNLCEVTDAERAALHYHRRRYQLRQHQQQRLLYPEHLPPLRVSASRHHHHLINSGQHRPIPHLWSGLSRAGSVAEALKTGTSDSLHLRVRRAYDEPLGSQASPFAPSDPGISASLRQHEPALAPRSGGRPFTPPTSSENHRETSRKGHTRNRKKTSRGGWQIHHHDDNEDDHVIEEEEVVEEEDDPHRHVHEYKAPLLNPAHDGHIKIKSHRPPADPHWSEKDEAHEHNPWDDGEKYHHDEGWKREAQYKINDVKLRIPPVKFRLHITPNVKIISGSKDPLEKPPPPEPEEHFPWEKPQGIPDLAWWPSEAWPDTKNCTVEDQKDSQECKDMEEKERRSSNLTKKKEKKNNSKFDKRKDSSSRGALSSKTEKRSNATKRLSSNSNGKSRSSTSSSASMKKRRVTRRTGETSASTRVQRRLRLAPRRNGVKRSRHGVEFEAYHLPASPWSPPKATWGGHVYVEDENEEVEINDSKNEHRGSDAEGDAKNGTGWDPQINWQDSPIHFAAYKRRWPPDTPRYSPMFKVRVNPRIWTEAPPSTTTTTTEPTTTIEEDETANIDDEDSTEGDEDTTTEEPTTIVTTEEGTTEEATTTEAITTGQTTPLSTTEISTRFTEPTTNDKGQFSTTPMLEEVFRSSTTSTSLLTTTEIVTTTVDLTTRSTEIEPTTTASTTTSTEEITTMPSGTPATTEEVSTEPLTKSDEATRAGSDSRGRRPDSRIPKVFNNSWNRDVDDPEENAINMSASGGSSSTTTFASTTVSGTTTSWLFGLTNTTTEFNPSLEREEPPLNNSVGRNRSNATDLRPRRRLGTLNPVKIDVSSPEELAGVAVNAKVLHLFLGGPNSTSLHDSVVTVAKAVNQYNNYYKKR